MSDLPELVFGVKAGPDETPREMTKDECVDKLLKQIAGLAEYWATVQPNPAIEGDKEKTPLDRCNGLVFSILAILDGSNIVLPAFNLVPASAEGDEEYLANLGQHWWPENAINDEVSLHNLWSKYEINPE